MIVITTPTGQIGGRLLDILLNDTLTRGEGLRVIVRDPAKLPASVRDRVDVITGSHGDAEVVDRAFAGADAVFWLVPPDTRAPSLEAVYSGFTRSAAEAFVHHKVGHVVGVSALGRGTPVAGRAGQVTASLDMDDLIAGTGAAYRALANPTFMDNLLRQLPSIRDHGVFTDVVSADRKAPTAACRDIAAAAAGLLLDRSWTGVGEVPVLGPEDLSPNDQARIMSEVLGRPVRYERQSYDDCRAAFGAYGAGDAFIEGYVEMMRAKDDGLDGGVRRTAQTAGSTSFRTWCEEVLKPAIGARTGEGWGQNQG
ncbi:NAD(P)H-binding protein [Streptomyces sp. NPDC005865]|uniref:NAD(P)H-binding protein n=1 Tax=Streptomyces sp. NPDC005865 TaxID=3155453 RepID=UPI003401A0CA